MANVEVRPILAREVEAILDMLAPWETRAFFERYFQGNPAFRPEHVCAAFDGARPVGCAQILPKTVRVVGGTVLVGGIGQVWTEPDYRRQGLAPRVLRRCIEVMEAEQFGLSLLFASRFALYGALGWRSYPRRRAALVAWPDSAPAFRVRAFDAERDLPAVRALYEAYTAGIPGTTVRDDAAWRASLVMAGDPSERFLLAVDVEDRPVAYMRGTRLDGAYVVLEYA